MDHRQGRDDELFRARPMVVPVTGVLSWSMEEGEEGSGSVLVLTGGQDVAKSASGNVELATVEVL
jgi:hypothetical protein